MALKMHHSLATHPGDWLKTEVVEAHGLKVGEAAGHLGVSRQTLSKLLNAGQGLTADMAIRVEKAFGISADTLMRMQTTFDMAKARGHEKELEVEPYRAARHADPFARVA
ncbi:HigA family addiction module antitoxin [Novosphingobium album (ex Liu et al. 2023)]|uniref:HigA family addiction module antitoxin n=1 Tax=Novosphingobium album (ex Liu et al. 2023) TaxID=3031130 RepID=A0ABT5WX09_9SPHN|nr:HigA family addiction module antitoxin [Novosphingobium album (ex Liu et al. 2023)]MDE8654444.1 HigA family addiction module antitoxin [Novosphingobium album (ex Liu et al. 2023)]